MQEKTSSAYVGLTNLTFTNRLNWDAMQFSRSTLVACDRWKQVTRINFPQGNISMLYYMLSSCDTVGPLHKTFPSNRSITNSSGFEFGLG